MWRRLSITRRGVLAIALAAGLCAAAGGPAAYAARRNANPGVLPIQSKPHGASYGEWRARWWQWAFSVPAADNPLLDETGADCAAGQKGHVWFLAGVINVSGEAERTCTVPTGTALFFPIFNVQYDNALCFDPDLTHSIAELRAIAKALADNTTDLAVEVDGVALKNLRNYRAASPVFSITLPTGNVLEHLGCDDAVAGTYPNAVSDGYWIMLAPLPPGEHTIHFHARALPTDIDEDPKWTPRSSRSTSPTTSPSRPGRQRRSIERQQPRPELRASSGGTGPVRRPRRLLEPTGIQVPLFRT